MAGKNPPLRWLYNYGYVDFFFYYYFYFVRILYRYVENMAVRVSESNLNLITVI